MDKKDSTYFNMKISSTEKEIMDFVTNEIHEELGMSKAGFIMRMFRQEAYDYICLHYGYPEEVNIPDEMLLSMLKSAKRQEDLRTISVVGPENYRKMIQDFKKVNPDFDVTYMESLLKEYESNKKDEKECK